MITIKEELHLEEFEAWSGGKETLDTLTDSEINIVNDYISELWFELSRTELNDILWFETDMIAEWLGYSDFEELLESRVN